jgi:hypothetical protein
LGGVEKGFITMNNNPGGEKYNVSETQLTTFSVDFLKQRRLHFVSFDLRGLVGESS